MPPVARRPNWPSKARCAGPPSSKTSEKVQKESAWTSPAGADGLGERGADVGGVAEAVAAGDVPLGPEQGEVRVGGGVDLAADMVGGGADAVFFGHVFIAQGLVGTKQALDGYRRRSRGWRRSRRGRDCRR
jgi:hypothetical protein